MESKVNTIIDDEDNNEEIMMKMKWKNNFCSLINFILENEEGELEMIKQFLFFHKRKNGRQFLYIGNNNNNNNNFDVNTLKLITSLKLTNKKIKTTKKEILQYNFYEITKNNNLSILKDEFLFHISYFISSFPNIHSIFLDQNYFTIFPPKIST